MRERFVSALRKHVSDVFISKSQHEGSLILFSSFLACCKMIPIRIGLGKTFCREEMYWQPLGHASSAAVLLGKSKEQLLGIN